VTVELSVHQRQRQMMSHGQPLAGREAMEPAALGAAIPGACHRCCVTVPVALITNLRGPGRHGPRLTRIHLRGQWFLAHALRLVSRLGDLQWADQAALHRRTVVAKRRGELGPCDLPHLVKRIRLVAVGGASGTGFCEKKRNRLVVVVGGGRATGQSGKKRMRSLLN